LLYRQNRLRDHPDEGVLRYAAARMLGSIGVFGKPFSPKTTFGALIEGCNDPGFLCGSVQPISIRAAVALQIHRLPPADRVRRRSSLAISLGCWACAITYGRRRPFEPTISRGSLPRHA
jgi:hypothetical protein